MSKAKLFKKLPNNQIQCLACQRYCKIAPDSVGFCLSRLNKNGELYSLNYGVINGIQVDPIEKKPLYHFFPGTQVLSLGSYGCNYRCKQCLNHWCSWGQPATNILEDLKNKSLQVTSLRPELRPRGYKLQANFTSPKEIMDMVLKRGYPGIAFTYNEPSIWPEYVFDVAKLAKEKGLYTVYVTNGSWSKETLEFLSSVIDAANIDIKGFSPETYQKMGAFWGELLKNTALAYKKYKIFLELTTLIIPGINDSQKELEKLAHWIVKDLGPEVPWHLSRFDPSLAPDQQFRQIPETPVKTLKMAYEIGKKTGLDFVYVWAPPKNWEEELFSIGDTFCPKCGKLTVKRSAWQPELVGVKKVKDWGCCQFCNKNLNLKLS